MRGAGGYPAEIELLTVLTLEPDLGNASVGTAALFGDKVASILEAAFFMFATRMGLKVFLTGKKGGSEH